MARTFAQRLAQKNAHLGQIRHDIKYLDHQICEAEMEFDDEKVEKLKAELKALRIAETRYDNEIQELYNSQVFGKTNTL